MQAQSSVLHSHWNDPASMFTAQLSTWEADGYVILRGFFARAMVDAVNALVDRLWNAQAQLDSNLSIDVFLESAQQRRMLFAQAPLAARGAPYKINDLYLESPLVRSIMLDQRLREILNSLLDGEPLLMNSLNFELGSGQPAHVDTLFISPRKREKLVVVWLALEAIDPASGPLVVYPGSNKIPAFVSRNGGSRIEADEMPQFNQYMDAQLRERGIGAHEFIAETGDILIWHAQLLHGGKAILDPHKTRKSLVCHYFRKQDYWPQLWRVRRAKRGGHYYVRPHQSVANQQD